MCGPLCPVGIAGGLGLARLLGVDEFILGLWIGALIVSFSVVLNKFLIKKGKGFPFSFWLILLATWLISFFPIYRQLSWDSSVIILGLPRVIAGSLAGAVMLFLIAKINDFAISRHNGQIYFHYQRIIIPLAGLLAISAVFYWML
ncbi:MAG: hypothetical protein NT136_02525 [Candidatus Moranbacteria bacterium]|nr:hypothetical protein [Candidatus Moranbacteria bacterium]